MSINSQPIIVEQSFPRSIQDVWSAITQLDQMRQWFFENIEAFEPVVGFETGFDVQSPNAIFPHRWKLTEVEREKKIVYNWTYEGFEGEGHVSFELFKQEMGTLLRLTATGMETFTLDIPEFSRESCIGGWNYFIKERLTEYLKRE